MLRINSNLINQSKWSRQRNLENTFHLIISPAMLPLKTSLSPLYHIYFQLWQTWFRLGHKKGSLWKDLVMKMRNGQRMRWRFAWKWNFSVIGKLWAKQENNRQLRRTKNGIRLHWAELLEWCLISNTFLGFDGLSIIPFALPDEASVNK